MRSGWAGGSRGRVALEALAALAGFGALAVLVTWPLAAHFDSTVTGAGGGGDASGYVWDFWRNATHGLSLWGTQVQEQVSAPFGRELPGSVNALLLTTIGPALLATELASPVVAYNVVALSGLALSGASMYLLIRWLGLGAGPAVWAGAAYAVFPYEAVRVAAHIPLSHMECFPLMVMASVNWLDRPGRRASLWLALAVAFGWLSNPYYGFMCLVIAVVVVALGAIAAWRAGGLRAGSARAAEAAVAVAVLVGIPLAALLASSQGAVENVFARNRIELELYGARLTDYLRPVQGNPLWDDILGNPYPSPLGERTNYVGWTAIALALVGLGAVLWRRADPGRRARLVALVGLPVILVLAWFSLATPTRWLGLSIDMPSALVFDAAPFLRAFARFVAPVMAVLLALGAVGLWSLLRGRGEVGRAAILIAALLVTAIELPPHLPIGSAAPATINGVDPAEVPVWAWLRDHPSGEIVYEQPGTPNEGIERFYMYGQITHGHRITNGNLFPGQLGSDFTAQTGNPLWASVPRTLASVGVGLVTIEPWAYALAGRPAPDPRTPPEGYSLVRAFPDGSGIWRVTAAPADAVAVPRSDGWWGPELLGDGRVHRWMAQDGRVTVVARRAGRYRVAFTAAGLERTAAYPLRVDGSGVAADVPVAPGPARRYAIELELPAGRTDLRVHNEGPAARRIGPADPRIASVLMSEWTVRLRRPA